MGVEPESMDLESCLYPRESGGQGYVCKRMPWSRKDNIKNVNFETVQAELGNQSAKMSTINVTRTRRVFL